MTAKRMIKLVAFDLDGTIADTIPMCIRAFQEAVSSYTHGVLSEEEIIQTFGLNEEGMIKQLVSGDDWLKALDDFYAIYERMHSSCPAPLGGIYEFIQELKDHSIAVALVTGKGAKSCMITLKQFGMEACFERVETGSAEKNRKAEAITDLLRSYHLQVDEMLYIGDAFSDVTACREAGVTCLSAAWLISPEERVRLEAYNPQNVFASIEDLRLFFREAILV